ncbi:MAG: FtsQ-type POTRA domain-containing protein [Candidatus Daviesbacteria bacterium]|nr:FtsQ-type POTRA domain-containing protein [Candidatus Daviesbacteria bacterium]
MWKKKQRKHFPRKIIILIILFLIAGFLSAFYKSNFFTIKKIDIQAKDISCANEDQLKVSSGLMGQNFFLIESKKIEENLKSQFICMKSAAVAKYFPNKIYLQVSNRKALAVFAATPSAELVKEFFLIDNEGVVFGKGEENSDFLKIYIFNQNLSVGQKLTGIISDIPKVLDKIKTLNIQINTARINQDIFTITSNPPVLEILFRLNNNVDVQLASLQLILNKAKMDLNELEFIDLRFDKPVVRFAPKKK